MAELSGPSALLATSVRKVVKIGTFTSPALNCSHTGAKRRKNATQIELV